MGDAPNGWPPAAEGSGGGGGGSALLAMRTHHAVQRYVCLACLRQARARHSSHRGHLLRFCSHLLHAGGVGCHGSCRIFLSYHTHGIAQGADAMDGARVMI